MTTPVHILCTVRNPALLDAALLVFKTLRIGFPTAPVYVWGNGLTGSAGILPAITQAAHSATFNNLPSTSHDAWIEQLLLRSTSPFWICDTDIVFHSSIESFVLPDECVFAGRWEPEFNEEWTRSIHVERLHTCLMWFDPARVRAAMNAFMSRFPHWGRTAQFPFVRQHFVPVSGAGTRFYDSTAGLWHANIGTPFTPAQDAAFDHLHCATYADLISQTESLRGLPAMHQQVYADFTRARGLKAQQDAYYATRQPKNSLCEAPI